MKEKKNGNNNEKIIITKITTDERKKYDNTYCDGWCFKSPNGQKDNDNSTFGAVHVPLFTHVPDESYHSGRFKASVVAPLVMHVVFVQRCYFPLSNNNLLEKTE